MALVAASFAALEAGRGFGEIGVDTLVLSRFGAGALPYLFVALGATSLVAALAYGAALGRLPRIRLLSGLPLAAGAVLIVERGLMATGHPAALALTWLTVYAVGAIALTIVWTLAGAVFDSRQARRLFPLCTAAAIAGSFFGTLLAGPVARSIGTESLVLLEAALLGVLGLGIVGVSRITTVRAPTRRRDQSIVADLRIGFDEVVRLPLMRLVAIAYVLLAILMFSVTYPFLLAASETFPAEADLATALGLLSAAVTATSFLVSIVFANRVYARVGVAGAALLLPIVYLAGFSLWLVAFSFATAALVRFTQQVSQRGISNAAWTAFYNMVPTERRAQVLAFNDGVPGQIGTMLSGLLLLASGTLLARDQVFWLGAGTAILCAVVVLGIRRRYAASVLRTLRGGLGEQVLEGGPGLGVLTRDPAVAATLATALRTAEPSVRCMAAGLLGRSSIEDAGAALVAAVDDDPDASVRVAALEAIARLGGPPTAAPAAQASLGDDDPRVREAAVRALGAVVDDPRAFAAVPQLVDLAADTSPGVRAAIAWLYGAHGLEANCEPIFVNLLGSDEETDRVAGLDAIRRLRRPIPSGGPGRFLTDPSPKVRAATIEALAASGELETSLDAVVEALDDDVAVVRGSAATALAGRDRATPGLLVVLAGDSPTSAGRGVECARRARSRGSRAADRLGPRPAGARDRPAPRSAGGSGRRGVTRRSANAGRLPPGRPRLARAARRRPGPSGAGRARCPRGRRRHPPDAALRRRRDASPGDRGPRLAW